MAKSLAKKAVVGLSMVLFVGFIGSLLLVLRVNNIGNVQEDAVAVCAVAKDALADGHDPFEAIGELNPSTEFPLYHLMFGSYHIDTLEAVSYFTKFPRDEWYISLGSGMLYDRDKKVTIKELVNWCPELREYDQEQLADSAEDSSGSPG